jgi:hypothetical protein
MVYASPVGSGRRPTKFTPERLEQIKDLVARGVDREEIARLLGVTVGSLQVTCSRLGISLRRPRVPNGVEPAATKGKDPCPGASHVQRLRAPQRQRASR